MSVIDFFKRSSSVLGNKGFLRYLIHVVSTVVQVDNLFSDAYPEVMVYLAEKVPFTGFVSFFTGLSLLGRMEVQPENFFFMSKHSVRAFGISFVSLPGNSALGGTP